MSGMLLKRQKTAVKKNNILSKFPKRRKRVNYSKWGYIFIAPFFITYAIFSLIPLITTFYNSFFECYEEGLSTVGPNFVGLENFKIIFSSEVGLVKYFANTLIIWLLGFIPQIIFSLLFASWFADIRLRLKATGFFKTVIYMPNLIMASAFAMLFFTLFSDNGPVNNILVGMGLENPYRFFANVLSTRSLIALMNFLMWFGNTTILLMAAIMGVDTSLYESAQIDGANSKQVFWQITIPLIKPILIYVMITSLVGGIQMFDVPQILTNGEGGPNRTSMTMVMYLNKHLFSKNYGVAGAVSVILFFISAVLSVMVFMTLMERDKDKGKKRRKGAKAIWAKCVGRKNS